MIEKSLYVIIFMYAASFSILGIQYVLGDAFNFSLKNAEGVEIKSSILAFINQDTLNQVTGDIATVNSTYNSTLDAVENSFSIGINIAFDLLTLLTGTYIFNVLYLLGVPPIFIAGMIILYALLLGRAIIAYVRGV